MQYKFKKIEDAPISSGTKVLLRLDLNVPIVDGQVRDDFRIKKSLKTLEFLKNRGAKTIIIAHTDSKETDSLKVVAEYLNTIIKVDFVPSLEELPERLGALGDGGILFLENIRNNPGEIKNDLHFAQTLASLADIYVNDAFSVSHRAHASIVGIPNFLPSYAGFLFCEEVVHVSRAFNPPRPFLFILAGANKKLTSTSLVSETKFPLVTKFLKSADSVFVGGALANDLFKAEGFEIGHSKHSESDFGFEAMLHNPKLLLPLDVVVGDPQNKISKKPNQILPEEIVFDAGQETLTMLTEKLKSAQFVLWNGTIGAYEQGFVEGTEALAKAIAESGVEAIVGGGDTLAAIDKLALNDKFSFVSTGGGAMLDFLASETLPGIAALEASAAHN
ncbi:MAG: phosphoglycerate kinase [Patescibacteria group bacterium]